MCAHHTNQGSVIGNPELRLNLRLHSTVHAGGNLLCKVAAYQLALLYLWRGSNTLSHKEHKTQMVGLQLCSVNSAHTDCIIGK